MAFQGADSYPYPKKRQPNWDYGKADREREAATKKMPHFKYMDQMKGVGTVPNNDGKDDPVEIEISKLAASPKNSFREIQPEVYEEMKASIKANGLVYPIVIRPRSCVEQYAIAGDYEILAGHNRVRAAQELGWDTIKANIIEVDDVTAVRIINDSNLQRAEVSELEKAWAYRQLFDAMNRKGNNQYSGEVDAADELCEHGSQSSEPKNRTTDVIGEMYGLTGRTVSKKIRLTYLVDKLYKMYERKDISQRAAVDLSYLDVDAQNLLLDAKDKYRVYLSDQNCHNLRVEYNDWKRNSTDSAFGLQRILPLLQATEAEEKQQAAKPEKMKKYTLPESLFPTTVKKNERQSYVEKALAYILENGIEL